ncbi:MAG: YtxH domain-containing protein [Candidatus Eremiobacteraeota bacterium]|nr:YtxH domain-containing protein [Candidatus Eremiobacteraeota bacterium]
MSSEDGADRQGGGGFVAGFVVGALVGGALAMLLAPQTGEETRDLVWGKAREAGNFAMDATGDLRDRVSSVAENVQSGAADLYERGRTVVEKARTNVGTAVSEGQDAADAARTDLSSQSATSNSSSPSFGAADTI